MTQHDLQLFEEFTAPLIGKPVTHLWHGYGSAIFIEFGILSPTRRRDGSEGNARGEMTLSIEWSWRVEGKRRVWVGSFSEKKLWERMLPKLKGSTVTAIAMFGHLGEVCVEFSNGLRLSSFMTAEGDPAWSLNNPAHVYISIVAGRLVVDARDARPSLVGLSDA